MGTQGAAAEAAVERRVLVLGWGLKAPAKGSGERGERGEHWAKAASPIHMGNCLSWLYLTRGDQVSEELWAGEKQAVGKPESQLSYVLGRMLLGESTDSQYWTQAEGFL